MTINIINEVQAKFQFHYKELAEKVIRCSVEMENFPYDPEVNLTISDNIRIQEINREFRGIDRATDVLSFPMIEYASPADFSGIEQQYDTINPDTGEVMLGDIVLSADRIKAQAEEYGHSQKREFAFLIVHSMLHLFGYDHMEPEEASVMETHQKMILDALKIFR
ncbi:Probable rRNA maturation factor [uncultured Roseburia sp.]|uniref:Endoribonuclease YbeY n=1 Tax=Brotonthovivens ammoniilytica TaxID=2981725 RepID=A0ABT2TGA1_9FIRM|nr:rRNA maturation RNase YbeY [Brotonthovivens ammoniilytica]MCU6761209.1 rRNA maturation RNase YbeY [Brotonthovivens ammoniilytica]SCI21964.1 Probable rRNA maturation factor [uncultured Roseburia sp.]